MIKKILFIDDDPSVLLISSLMLKNLGYEIIAAEGGEKALNILRKNHDFDLIFLDLMMPDIYGIDVLKAIKSDHNISHIPVILQTGAKNNFEFQEAYKEGVLDILLKPYNKSNLKEIINKHFLK